MKPASQMRTLKSRCQVLAELKRFGSGDTGPSIRLTVVVFPAVRFARGFLVIPSRQPALNPTVSGARPLSACWRGGLSVFPNPRRQRAPIRPGDLPSLFVPDYDPTSNERYGLRRSHDANRKRFQLNTASEDTSWLFARIAIVGYQD